MHKQLLLAGSLALASAASLAGTVSFTEEFGVDGDATAAPLVGTLLESLTLPKFSAGLTDGFQTVQAGDVLTGVVVTAGSSMTSAGTVTNLSLTPADFDLSVRLFANWVADQTAGAVAASNASFGGFGDTIITDSALGVGTNVTANVGGTTGILGATLANLGVADAAALATFVGPGSFTYQYSGEALTNINGSTGSGVAEFQQAVSTAAYGFLTVEYLFDDAPPPQRLPAPGPVALMAAGLLGFAGARRLKK
jgi:hypothetical protein